MGFVLIGMGIGMILFGFKVFNLFKDVFESDKEEEWFIKFGLTFKIFGIVTLIIGILETIRYLYF